MPSFFCVSMLLAADVHLYLCYTNTFIFYLKKKNENTKKWGTKTSSLCIFGFLVYGISYFSDSASLFPYSSKCVHFFRLYFDFGLGDGGHCIFPVFFIYGKSLYFAIGLCYVGFLWILIHKSLTFMYLGKSICPALATDFNLNIFRLWNKPLWDKEHYELYFLFNFDLTKAIKKFSTPMTK